MQAEAVQTRRDLEEYLGQSLIDEYYLREEGRVTRQVATFLKTYLLDLHATSSDPERVAVTEGPFAAIHETNERSLWRLVDDNGAAYFLDTLDQRFPILHTIEKAEFVAPTLERLTRQSGVDSAWLTTRMLESQELGQVIGFRLFHQPGLGGLASTASALQLARELGKDEPPPTRVSVLDYVSASRDLSALRRTEFGRRSGLDSLRWRSSEADTGAYILDEVWYDGRITARGTSWPKHLENVYRIRDRYAALLAHLESHTRVEVVESRMVGEPIRISFSGSPVANTADLAGAIADPSGPMRLWGTATTLDEGYEAIDAVDLHTGHRLSLEVTGRELRVYLRSSTCGNVLPRLLVHLERLVDAQLTTSLDDVTGVGLTSPFESDS
jgi:hypothetical protein